LPNQKKSIVWINNGLSFDNNRVISLFKKTKKMPGMICVPKVEIDGENGYHKVASQHMSSRREAEDIFGKDEEVDQ
jgi:hypothetical protein